MRGSIRGVHSRAARLILSLLTVVFLVILLPMNYIGQGFVPALPIDIFNEAARPGVVRQLLRNVSQTLSLVNLRNLGDQNSLRSKLLLNREAFSVALFDHLVGDLISVLQYSLSKTNETCEIIRQEEKDPRGTLTNQITPDSPDSEQRSTISTHVFVCCNSGLIHFAVLIPRDESAFYWSANINFDYTVCRGIDFGPSIFAPLNFPLAIDTQLLSDLRSIEKDGIQVLEPQDPSTLQWHLEKSRFLECNGERVTLFRKLHSDFIDPKANNSGVAKTVSYIRDVALSLKIPLMLYAGSLLGWYRQCDHISYSGDADFIVRDGIITDKVFGQLWKNKRLTIERRYGSPSSGLELVFYSDLDVKVDLFTMKEEANKSYTFWFTWDQQWMKWNVYYPKVDWSSVCTASFLGVLNYVPCDALAFIEAEYGRDGWFEPKKFKYSDNYGFSRGYNEAEWDLFVYKYPKTPRLRNCTNPTILWGCCQPPTVLDPSQSETKNPNMTTPTRSSASKEYEDRYRELNPCVRIPKVVYTTNLK